MNISVLIPTYNAEDFILECLNSVASASREGLTIEVIVVDDASTDNTVKLVEKFQQSNSIPLRLKELQSNGGPGQARAHGLKIASGDLIACLDADDLVPYMRFQQQAAIFRSRREVVLCGGDIVEFQHHDKRRIRAINFPVNHADLCADMLFYAPVWGSTSMFRKILLEKIDYPNFRIGEDWLFAAMAAKFGELTGTGTPTVFYRRHSRQITASASNTTETILPIWQFLLNDMGIKHSETELRLHALCSPYVGSNPSLHPDMCDPALPQAWENWSRKLIAAGGPYAENIQDRCQRIQQFINSCIHLGPGEGNVVRVF